MLKQILAYIKQGDSHNMDFKDFVMNVIANVISNQSTRFK